MHQGMKPASHNADEFSGEKTAISAETHAGNFPHVAENFPRHILVVDDEPLIRWSVSESLSDLGYDVEQAVDAESALRTVTTTALPFDGVVLDLRLPDMNDLSLLATLHQLIPDARLVLMTAFGTPELLADAAKLGAVAINKPFELDDLTRLVSGASNPRAVATNETSHPKGGTS
jgi:DNA-binding NtrC family response regulator